jgi:hypothetical protein
MAMGWSNIVKRRSSALPVDEHEDAIKAMMKNARDMMRAVN